MARRKWETAHSPSIGQVNGTRKASRTDAWTAQNTAIATRLSKWTETWRLALFLEFFLFGRTQTRGRSKRFAIVVEREIADVKE